MPKQIDSISSHTLTGEPRIASKWLCLGLTILGLGQSGLILSGVGLYASLQPSAPLGFLGALGRWGSLGLAAASGTLVTLPLGLGVSSLSKKTSPKPSQQPSFDAAELVKMGAASQIRNIEGDKQALNRSGSGGNCPLHEAILRDDEDAAVALLAHKETDIESRNAKGCTPLHLASELDQMASMDALLRRGASVDVYDKRNESPLDKAARAGNVSAVEWILANKPKRLEQAIELATTDQIREMITASQKKH